MGYADYIRALLKPLRVYALAGGFEDMETETLGGALDEVDLALTLSEREMLPLTAESYGLENLLSLLTLRPAADTTGRMQTALSALLRIGNDSFTAAALNDTLCGCGLNAQVRETEQAGVVEVSFPGVAGEPDDLDALCAVIEDILPCHLQINYVFTYITWQRLESLFANWSELESGAASWSALERMV
ncbi:MAG: DUF2313 domain-containing protein [Oscillospiraceae bacterium]|nr:DUF2313 domain-containing protein [Oscillospiraceae bacterium]